MADYSYIAIEKKRKRNKRKYGIGQQGKKSNRNCVRRGVFH